MHQSGRTVQYMRHRRSCRLRLCALAVLGAVEKVLSLICPVLKAVFQGCRCYCIYMPSRIQFCCLEYIEASLSTIHTHLWQPVFLSPYPSFQYPIDCVIVDTEQATVYLPA